MQNVTVDSSKAPRSNLQRFDPFSTLQREINSLISSFDRGWADLPDMGFKPSTDVTETDGQIKVTAELPGLEPKDVKIELVGDLLTISGEKRSEREDKSEKRHAIERTFGSFSRSIYVPSGTKAEDVEAAIANGVLTVTIRKPPVQAPEAKTIEIKPA